MRILKKLTFGAMLLVAISAQAGVSVVDGNEIYLDAYMQVTNKKKLASYYCTLEEKTEDGFHYKAYFLSGELKMDGWYSDEEMTTEHGLFTYFYASGQIESVGEYSQGVKAGVWKRFDKYGKEKPEKVYQSLQIMQAIEDAKKLEQKNK